MASSGTTDGRTRTSSWLSSIASGAKAVAQATVDVSKAVYNDLNSFPTSVACSTEGCGTTLDIPAQAWDWTCTNAHYNPGSASACTTCRTNRTVIQPPTLRCGKCGRDTVSPISNARKYAATAGNVAKKTVILAKDVTVKGYNSLTARPSAVECPTCKDTVAVPENAWLWACSNGHTNDGTSCTTCQAPKPQGEIEVLCGKCGSSIEVPGSNARLYASKAGKVAKQTAIKAKDVSISAYHDLTARPSVVKCPACQDPVAVPENAWLWNCPNGHANDGTVCTTCQAPKPQGEVEVTCGKCSSTIPVPGSNARVYAAKAGAMGKQAVSAVKEKGNELAAAPQQFHCSECNIKLQVPQPRPWVCEVTNCGTQNAADVAVCSACKQKKIPRVVCGGCSQVTVIPSSVFEDSMRRAASNAKQNVETAKSVVGALSEGTQKK